MTTQNAGAALEDTLRALGIAMKQGDRLIAIDTGSTDKTLTQLKTFGEVVGCDLIQLGNAALSDGEALALALDMAQTPYLMLLGPQDRLNQNVVQQLRKRLKLEQPELAMFNSGWWHGDPTRAVDRIDAARASGLPPLVSAVNLYGLCPDPRRCVISRDIWKDHCEMLINANTPVALYTALIAECDNIPFMNAKMVLHPQDLVDPTPLLITAATHITALPRAAQPAALRDLMIWIDDAVVRTPTEAADVLIRGLEAFSGRLPRGRRKQLRNHDGPAGALFEAHWRSGREGALLRFVLGTLVEQQRQNEALIADYTRLKRNLQAALPGAQYLRDLYDRARDL